MKAIFTSFIFLFFNLSATAQDYALKRLENSPRHHEWIKVQNGDREIHCFVAFPERADDAPTIIVIHENRGLTDWVRSMTDKLAEAGYLAIAPDMLSDFSEEYPRTTAFPDSDAARTAIYELDQNQVTEDLNEVFRAAGDLDGSNGEISVMGFCWGGSQSFRMATNNPDLKNAFVFYGTGPKDLKDIERIEAKVYGFYGETDQRVNASIEQSEKLMKEAGKFYEYKIYPGAGHAYMRRGDDPDEDLAQKAAALASMEWIKEILSN